MKLPIIIFSWKQFTFSSDGKTLISEASDLENRHLQSLYNDACDRGFSVQFERKGGHIEVITFVMSEVMKSDEGEVTGWNYIVSSESVRKYPEYVGTKAIVFND
jgi:hypothetical protein